MSEPTPRTDALKAELVMAAHSRISEYPKDGWLDNFCRIADKMLVSHEELERTLAAQRTALLALFDEAERTGNQGIAVRGREILGTER